MKVSYELTKELYNQRSTWIKFKEGISQLLSPILKTHSIHVFGSL